MLWLYPQMFGLSKSQLTNSELGLVEGLGNLFVTVEETTCWLAVWLTVESKGVFCVVSVDAMLAVVKLMLEGREAVCAVVEASLALVGLVLAVVESMLADTLAGVEVGVLLVVIVEDKARWLVFWVFRVGDALLVVPSTHDALYSLMSSMAMSE